jgi:hypothetical protein
MHAKGREANGEQANTQRGAQPRIAEYDYFKLGQVLALGGSFSFFYATNK